MVYTLPQGPDPDDALFSESGAMNIMFFLDKVCTTAPVVNFLLCTPTWVPPKSSIHIGHHKFILTRTACPGPKGIRAARMHWQTPASHSRFISRLAQHHIAGFVRDMRRRMGGGRSW